MKKFKLLIGLTLMLLITSAFAQGQKIVLNFHDQIFRGEQSINLKERIKQTEPYISFHRLELVGVKMVAKSRKGRGQAYLEVDHDKTYSETLNGNSYDFESNHPDTYNQVRFDNPSYSSRRDWLIHLKGTIKIKKLIIILKGANQIAHNKKIILNFNSKLFKGQQKISLKREIKKQNANINLNKFNIKRIYFIAKSKRGQGKVSLKIGRYISNKEIIDGFVEDFDNRASYTFYNTVLDDIGNNNSGVWQLLLHGNIKVKQVVIELERGNNGPWR